MSLQPLSRRTLLTGSAVTLTGAVAGYLVARNSDAATAKPSTSAANGYGPASGGGTALISLAGVPAAGIVAGGVVLTRDGAGGVHGVSATCTHQGCTVGSPRDGVVTCPCHGSQFDASTGKVLRGPATRPLPQVPVGVHDGQVVRR